MKNLGHKTLVTNDIIYLKNIDYKLYLYSTRTLLQKGKRFDVQGKLNLTKHINSKVEQKILIMKDGNEIDKVLADAID